MARVDRTLLPRLLLIALLPWAIYNCMGVFRGHQLGARAVKRISMMLILLCALPAQAIEWQTPRFVGDCYLWDTRRDAVRLVAYVMDLPQSQVANTVIFCDPWTPFGGMTFREIGERRMKCTDRRYWNWWIGCMTGLSNYQPGPVLLLHMHPNVVNFMVDVVLQEGASLGTQTRESLMCFWSFNHFVRLIIHEFNHTKGYRHGAAMAAEDRRVFDVFMSIERFRGFVLRYEWQECK